MHTYWHHPDIDPIIFSIPWHPMGMQLAIRWYSVLYVGGFLIGNFILKRLAREKRFLFTPEDAEILVMRLLISAVIGARVIYCVVYDPKTLMANPLYLFQVYKGGLSFHGALLGIILTAIHFSRTRGIPFWNLTDAMALATPVGLAMGRMGNFINGELYGRVSYVPWAMIYRDGGPDPRHPSQLYELFLEGVLLMAVLWFVKSRSKRDGVISVTFLVGYSLCRFTAEFFREPDVQVGYLLFNLSMGQWLSLLMLAVSLLTGYLALWRKPA